MQRFWWYTYIGGSAERLSLVDGLDCFAFFLFLALFPAVRRGNEDDAVPGMRASLVGGETLGLRG